MNEIRPRDRTSELIARAHEIVQRHKLPEFITDFRIVLGRSDGEPALFVLYKTVGEDADWLSEEWDRRSQAYRALDEAVLPELIEALDERYPYSILVPERRWDTYPD